MCPWMPLIPNHRRVSLPHLTARRTLIRTCIVPRMHDNFGDRSFSAAGPRARNSLLPHLRQDVNFARFQHKPNTFPFGNWSTTAHRNRLLFYAIEILLLIYLLSQLCVSVLSPVSLRRPKICASVLLTLRIVYGANRCRRHEQRIHHGVGTSP